MQVSGLWKQVSSGSPALSPIRPPRLHLSFQCIYPQNPTLSLIGLPLRVIPFALFEVQASLTVHVLRGTITCPQTSVCHDLEQRDAQKHGAGRARHVMGGRQWEYHDEILREIEAGIATRGDTVEVGAVRTEELGRSCEGQRRI
ncbi:hypothetical protein M427DRAFT_398758 [Gonapodya prolifera JEL478]|uniref:Uncharacterized protein n=1 Tax=Gonapodya prolifera (strain JEL478) TaxID=1344416 RepID=A0A139A6Q0_GONPJ|nr:hypothetical protein M427DRAFT_398758 [Gonapodya prolifera JEL478]|eukprot:KXS12318.1 hypothetical protein M427DRAFT_398758 [Gonapodya prolifera JEL478]